MQRSLSSLYVQTCSSLLLLALVAGGCKAESKHTDQSATTASEMAPTDSVMAAPAFPTPPSSLTDPSARAAYMIEHVFDPYSTLDSNTFLTPAMAEQFWVNYFAIAANAPAESRDRSLREAFRRGTEQLHHDLLEYASKYLYEVQSPIYNDEQYIELMGIAHQLQLLDTADEIRYSEQLKMYERNKPGSIASDFAFVDSEGRAHRLSEVEVSRWLLLLFYNPDCDVCADKMAYIRSSPLFGAHAEIGLTILCIATEGTQEEWHKHMDKVPTEIAEVGYDRGHSILRRSIYDIKAYPTLYLLDQERRVVLRDPMIEMVERWLMDTPNNGR